MAKRKSRERLKDKKCKECNEVKKIDEFTYGFKVKGKYPVQSVCSHCHWWP